MLFSFACLKKTSVKVSFVLLSIYRFSPILNCYLNMIILNEISSWNLSFEKREPKYFIFTPYIGHSTVFFLCWFAEVYTYACSPHSNRWRKLQSWYHSVAITFTSATSPTKIKVFIISNWAKQKCYKRTIEESWIEAYWT